MLYTVVVSLQQNYGPLVSHGVYDHASANISFTVSAFVQQLSSSKNTYLNNIDISQETYYSVSPYSYLLAQYRERPAQRLSEAGLLAISSTLLNRKMNLPLGTLLQGVYP